MELSGEGSGLELIALTLIDGATGVEMYAAVRNDGDTPACSAGMMISFIDKNEAIVTMAGGTLESGKYFRVDDGSGAILPCVDAGQVAMTAATGAGVTIAELGRIEFTFPAFGVTVVPVEGLAVSGVSTVSRDGGSAYTGTLTNEFDVTVSSPSVAIYPVNRVGRPLGVAKSTPTADTVLPGAGWTFETGTVTDAGTDHVAYPAATIPF